MLAALANSGNDSSWLWVCGDGPQMEVLKRRAQDFGVAGRVRFLGRRGDMPNVYNAADAYVHAAQYDNFPNVYLEAMVSGLPLLGPKADFPNVVSALRYIIEDGVHGHTYDLADTKALADLMDQCAGDAERMKRMGAAARELALSNYSWDRYINAVEEAVSGVCQKRKPSWPNLG